MISADVFEQNFSKICGEWADICYENPQEWLASIVKGNDSGEGTAFKKAVKNFAENVAGYDYVSPGYNGFHLLPLLAFLRSQLNIKILFIAHAPLQHVVELSLVQELLRPEDVIVCPSCNARNLLCNFHASLTRHTVVIPHFIQPLPRPESSATSVAGPRRIVSLGRITEDKLIHRQIDAMAILREQGIDNVVMEIAGPCHDDSGKTFRYINELKARIGRLGLEKQVVFRGILKTNREKAEFLADASMCINLSRAEEESFGKSCAEAVTMDIPVITTNWNGLPETIGRCGEVLPLFQLEGRQIFDVDPVDCARAIIKLLNKPPASADFARQKHLFSPESRGADYRNALLNPSSHAKEQYFDSAASCDFFNLIPAIRAISLSDRRSMYLASLGVHSEDIHTQKQLSRAAEQWKRMADLTFHSSRARGKQILAHSCISSTVPPVHGRFSEIPICAEQTVDALDRTLLADCLLECDSWARELTLTRLTALSRSLGEWSLAILKSHDCSSGFLLIAEVNRLRSCGDATGAARYMEQHLSGRNLAENDAALLLYFWEICQQAGSVTMMTEILKRWLTRYPDAPQCSALWPILASNLIIHEEQYGQGKEALVHLERIIPSFDTANLRAALTAMEYA